MTEERIQNKKCANPGFLVCVISPLDLLIVSDFEIRFRNSALSAKTDECAVVVARPGIDSWSSLSVFPCFYHVSGPICIMRTQGDIINELGLANLRRDEQLLRDAGWRRMPWPAKFGKDRDPRMGWSFPRSLPAICCLKFQAAGSEIDGERGWSFFALSLLVAFHRARRSQIDQSVFSSRQA